MEPLIQVTSITKTFETQKGMYTAVYPTNFEIYRGETLGLVGESGSGKSTVGRSILHLPAPTSGKIVFDGIDLATLPSKEMKKMRRKMQMIFQDPYASLNPRMTVEEILSEPLKIHKLAPPASQIHRVKELLSLVGLHPNHLHRYPHEFSGGQRQRISIARALAVEPEFIVCDEPLSALDMSIQAQIVNLLRDLQKTMGLTYLFIAHDLAMVRHLSDRVAVMYAGRIVEIAPAEEIYKNPKHPYTQALLASIPIPDPFLERQRPKVIL
jgi:ABC-type oligopeptide transport system ATPase subunit